MNKTQTEELNKVIEAIESSYEFMLAYAAQGREFENVGGDGPSIRGFLQALEQGLEQIGRAFSTEIERLQPQAEAREVLTQFSEVLDQDAQRAGQAVRLVLSVKSISSQLIDNLNASAHLRCLLTDVFLLDETLKIHQRRAADS